jgi:hypothetical protein
VTAVGGDNQVGTIGESLPALFVARVTDASGAPLRNAAVQWTLIAGSGLIVDAAEHPVTTTYTAPNGTTWVYFVPDRFGISQVGAAPPAFGGEPAVFTVDTRVLVLENFFWWDYADFAAPGFGWDITVPVGSTVRWVNTWPDIVSVASISHPAGGEPFSAVLGPHPAWEADAAEPNSFEFLVGVLGTWQWTRHSPTAACDFCSDQPRKLTAVAAP